MSHSYIPLHLKPTTTYYQVVERKLGNSIPDFTRKKFPLELDLPVLGRVSLRMNFRLYPPGIFVATVRLHAEVSEGQVVQFFEVRRFDRSSPIMDLLATSVSLAESADHLKLIDPPKLQSFSAFHLELPLGQSGARDFWRSNKPLLSGLVIGNSRYQDVSPEISAHLEEKSLEFNRKSLATLLIVDKQGLVSLNSFDNDVRHFDRAMDLIEIALVMKSFLGGYLQFRADSEQFFDFLFSCIRSWVRSPGALFSASVSNRFYWELLANEFGISQVLNLIEEDNQWLTVHLQEQAKYFATVSGEWWKQPTFAASLSLVLPNGKSGPLHTIKDADLRGSILEDIMEADRALASRSFKSALVMAGAAAEAILLAVLIERTNLNQNSLLRSGFADYVKHVKNEGVKIEPGTLGMVDNTLREWRNLVHPGKRIRSNVKVDVHKARAAVSGLHALVAEVDR